MPSLAAKIFCKQRRKRKKKQINKGETAHAAAATAYPRIDYVNNIFDKSEWENQARICLRDAARFSAMILYKFSQKQGVPFIEN